MTLMRYWPVKASAARLAALRYVELQLMECLGGWVHSTTSLHAKIRFSYDAYNQALICDALGMRLWQMRAPRHHTQAANAGIVELARALWNAPGPAARIAAVYRVIKPALREAYVEVERTADPIADEPTKRLAGQLIEQSGRDAAQGAALLATLPWSPAELAEADDFAAHLGAMLERAGGLLNLDHTEILGAIGRSRQAFDKSAVKVTHGARPSDWNVVDVRDLPPCEPFTASEGRRFALHTLLNREYMAAEARGKMLADFPELPWLLRMDLARQTWDEARHAEILTRRLREMDVTIGSKPVYHSTAWTAEANEPDPVKRLAYTNRIGEPRLAGTMAAWREDAGSDGDTETARVLDYILGDEAVHVAYGDWVFKLVGDDKPRLKDALVFGARLALERARQNSAANFQWQAKGKVVAASEQDRYIIRSLHAEGLDESDIQEMYTRLGLKAG
jgi:uncharacterized ferritin-like protein (DUF455 family)